MKHVEQAPAKVNLGLKIVGKRPDGYHDILSIFQTITLFDTLKLNTSDNTQLVCSDNTIPCGDDNLVLKAEKVTRDIFPDIPQTHFDLTKIIPAGGGLGGGSSDAAAAFRGLQKLYDLEIGTDLLEHISASIGSDIPFLIHGGTAIISGRGEVITPVEWSFDFTYIVIDPGISVSTAWAYQNLDNIGKDIHHYAAMIESLKAQTITCEEFLASLENDFEPRVFRTHPELKIIKHQLIEFGALKSLMTGSGACIIGIFNSKEDADVCLEALQASGMKVFLAKTYNGTYGL